MYSHNTADQPTNIPVPIFSNFTQSSVTSILSKTRPSARFLQLSHVSRHCSLAKCSPKYSSSDVRRHSTWFSQNSDIRRKCWRWTLLCCILSRSFVISLRRLDCSQNIAISRQTHESMANKLATKHRRAHQIQEGVVKNAIRDISVSACSPGFLWVDNLSCTVQSTL